MSASPTKPRLSGRNPSLDLLRGVAILMVVAAHCAVAAPSVVPGLTLIAGDYGQLGVQLFFMVSGYTMMLTYGERTDIAVEMQFYLLFPLIIWLFRRQHGPIICYATIALISAVARFAADLYLAPHLTASLPPAQAYLAEGFYYCWLPRQAVCFGLGILLYDVIERGSRPRLGALLLLGVCLTSSWGAKVALLYAASYALLAARVENTALSLFGRHSYAIYLVHFAVVPLVSMLLPAELLLIFVLTGGVSLALSYALIEPLIERRFNRLGHALAESVGRKAAVPATG